LVFVGLYMVCVKVIYGMLIIMVKLNLVIFEVVFGAVVEEVFELIVFDVVKVVWIIECKPCEKIGCFDLIEVVIVVFGGCGINGDFGLVEGFVDVLGVVVGVLRVVVDVGWYLYVN